MLRENRYNNFNSGALSFQEVHQNKWSGKVEKSFKIFNKVMRQKCYLLYLQLSAICKNLFNSTFNSKLKRINVKIEDRCCR